MTTATDSPRGERDVVTPEVAGAWPARLGILLSVTIFVVAVWILHRELRHIDFALVAEHVRAVPLARLLQAIGLTAASYLVLTGYDTLAMRYVKQRLPYARTAMTSFMAFAVGHNVGVASLSGGSVRYRIYSVAGLSAVDITKIILFCTLTFGIGASFMLGSSLLVMPNESVSVLHLPLRLIQAVGVLLLLFPLTYLVVAFTRETPLEIGNWTIAVPSGSVGLLQLGVSVLDLSCAAGVLYVLLAPALDLSFLTFLAIYLLAISAGLASNLPGGIGVFESVVLICLPDIDREFLLSTILVYRALYYIAPLTIALALLGGHELALQGPRLRKASDLASDRLSQITPQALGVMVFLAGAVLLASGASPAIEARLSLIQKIVPLPLLELSHLIGSTIGVGLLILARGLYRRLGSAYQLTVAALLLGIAASLLKGLDYEEAVILTGALVLLWSARREFYRRASLLDQRFTPSWVVSVALVIAASIWIGLLSYRHIEYSSELWWQFSLHGNAPRMLRASLAACVFALAFALWKILRPSPPGPTLPTEEALEAVRGIVRTASESMANVALLGDKRFLFDAAHSAFLMYRVCGRSWIALGDPTGPADQRDELRWRFRELCDRYDGWPVFYQISEQSLPLYVDMGLTLSKLGEDARVPLGAFSLEGSAHAELRQARNKALRAGASFEIVPREQIGSLMPELERISNAWLRAKATAEKGFSLGVFSARYIQNFDCAIVRHGGQIVAFANVWQAPAGRELSIDLMRYTDTLKGVMDYLLVELLLWGRVMGYEWFNLGMAPLSGLEQHPLATVWHKVGNLIFRYGDHFYNFEGLRHYKEKFRPVWQPRYLASPGGLALPRVLLDIAVVISGGVKGLLAK